MRVLGITQARIGSTRLPKKILLKIENKTLLEYHLERALQSNKVTDWIVATTNEIDSNDIVEIAKNFGIKYFKGDTSNVLKRFYEATKLVERPDYVVRITSDCPLIDPKLIDHVIDFAIQNKLHYCRTSEQFPDGVDVEVFTYSILVDAYTNAILLSDKEHVTPFMRRKFENEASLFKFNEDYHHIRLTVDEMADFDAIKLLITKLGSKLIWREYTKYIEENESLFFNQKIVRNEGYIKSLEKDDK
ncbi:cytidylyltransferase domain-containing protein [Aquirufa nivalisilvae]|uniref:cytidylyltransferase domain-containing protein n=1 Tax=Aquirufa nivalisilvae TaxID=2516557 RepID=UPI001D037755|nr:NTP transferase domain-containing protein [Aquirufa nivalisilvae]